MVSIDIFCDVIDNFGDAGVCWRLANIFAKEKGVSVNLFINDPNTLSKITGGADVRSLPQLLDGVCVRRWSDALESNPSEVVIETFGCRLPENFEKRMSQKEPHPIWINLEYLSAEDWVEGCHCLPSPHPSLNIEKTFFFPGVTPRTGGIMIEKDYFERQKNFAKRRNAFLSNFGLDPKIFTLYVFCYPSSPLELFYQALQKDARPVNLLLPRSAAAEKLLSHHRSHNCSFINVSLAEMVKQSDFDRFLWAADSLIVRGEDSFVRAQLAAKPFIWNIYPQTEDTHIKKLLAYSERIKPFFGEDFDLWLNMNLAWNQDKTELIRLWPRWRDAQESMRQSAAEWRGQLAKIGSLADNLWNFIQKQIHRS